MDDKVSQVVAIARRILEGKLDPIEGCRQINDLRWDLDDDGIDPRFDPFVEFEQKAFSFPPKNARHLWSAEYLTELDDKAQALLESERATLLEACRSLIRSYGGDAA